MMMSDKYLWTHASAPICNLNSPPNLISVSVVVVVWKEVGFVLIYEHQSVEIDIESECTQ